MLKKDVKKETIILGYKEDCPIIECYFDEKRGKGTLFFYCSECKNFHYHGIGEGYRTPHCYIRNPDSKFMKTEYYLQISELEKKRFPKEEYPEMY